MTELQQKKAAKAFAEKWLSQPGYEKGQTQVFWLELLHNVFGIEQPTEFIVFENHG